MSGAEGICTDCGLHYYGQALETRRNQVCVKCGSALEIRLDDEIIRHSFSDFKAEEYIWSEQYYWEELEDKKLLVYLARN